MVNRDTFSSALKWSVLLRQVHDAKAGSMFMRRWVCVGFPITKNTPLQHAF
jgi:hypothetical protein